MLDLALKVKKGRERYIKETHHILDTIRLLEPVQYVPTRLRRPLQEKNNGTKTILQGTQYTYKSLLCILSLKVIHVVQLRNHLGLELFFELKPSGI